MNALRRWLVVFVAWIFFIFNIERLSSPVNISMFRYIFLVLVTLMVLVVPFSRKLPLQVIIPSAVLLFLMAKLAYGRSVWGPALPLTVTEISAIILTSLLARRLNHSLDEFQEAVASISISRVGKLVRPFSTGQGEMYREVRRARQHGRPLTMLALEVDENSVSVAMNQMVKEVQQAMMEQFVLAGVAGVLCDELQDFDIIAQQDNRFLVLLPETKKEDLVNVINPLRQAVLERTGIKLQVGAAAFPGNGMTFESLVEEAIKDVDRPFLSRSRQVKPYPETALPSS